MLQQQPGLGQVRLQRGERAGNGRLVMLLLAYLASRYRKLFHCPVPIVPQFGQDRNFFAQGGRPGFENGPLTFAPGERIAQPQGDGPLDLQHAAQGLLLLARLGQAFLQARHQARGFLLRSA